MRDTFIYGLHGEDGVVRYVGKTWRPLSERLKRHFYAKSFRVGRWSYRNSEMRIVLLETVKADNDWSGRERFWIALYRQSGVELLNILKGGDGPDGNYVFTETHRANISAALRKGRFVPCAQCGTDRWARPWEEKRFKNLFCNAACHDHWQRRFPLTTNVKFPQAAIDAAAEKRRARTHCLRGHPLSGGNLRERDGRRICKTCQRDHVRKGRLRRLTGASRSGIAGC